MTYGALVNKDEEDHSHRVDCSRKKEVLRSKKGKGKNDELLSAVTKAGKHGTSQCRSDAVNNLHSHVATGFCH